MSVLKVCSFVENGGLFEEFSFEDWVVVAKRGVVGLRCVWSDTTCQQAKKSRAMLSDEP